jgi:succinoglycan biosynthesis protein ExoO
MVPDVTIIVPAWNAARTIERAVASALAQSGPAIEVLIADDASTDQTCAVVGPLCGSQVSYLRLPVNGGPSAARNAALAVARGKWIAVLDADDAMLPGRLGDLIGAAEAEGLDIITDNMWVETVAGLRELFFDEDLDGSIQRLDFAEYVRRNLMFARSRSDGYLKPVFRTAFLHHHGLRYDPAIRIGEDFVLVAEALACGARYGRRRSAGYVYSTQAGSISHRLPRTQARAMIEADLRFLAKYRTHLQPSGLSAMHMHLRRLRDGDSFIAMVDAIKARHILAFVREVVRRPAAIRHFTLPIGARLARFCSAS